MKGNQERLHNMFLNKFSFAQLAHLDCDKFETEEVGKRGRKMVRSYYVVPFTEAFGDFSVDWKGLESLCIAVTYNKHNKSNAGSQGPRMQGPRMLFTQ